MKISLDALLVLDAIDRKGSFAAAADSLHRVPSALTYTVQKLEQDLGLDLFDRSGHRARLTPAGAKLLEDGRRLIEAAVELEQTVQRVATGWETELRIACSDLLPLEPLFPVFEEFYATRDCGSQLRVSQEVFGGTWDALASGRADLVIGACGDGPAGSGYATRTMGEVPFVFAVAPGHPLAPAAEPLSHEDLLAHRAVAAADSSRHLAPRTGALLSGQKVLTMADMRSKVAAQCAGLGVGYVPRAMIAEELESGRLLAKEVKSQPPSPQLFVAWRADAPGKALRWFLKRLEDRDLCKRLLGEPDRAMHSVA